MMITSKKIFPSKWPSCLSALVKGNFTPVEEAHIRYPIIFAAEKSQIGEFAVSGEEEVNAAIDASEEAQKIWRDFSPAEKGRVLKNISDEITRRNDEIAYIESLDTSKVISETLEVDAVSARDSFEYFGAVAQLLSGQHIPLSPTFFGYTLKEPLGVCAGIGAWNYPIQGMAFKIAPALAVGNGFVFKPSEEAILSSLLLADIINNSGAPSGLVNVVLGGGETGGYLACHPKIAKVTFTGSLRTGSSIIKSVAESDHSRVLNLSADFKCGDKSSAHLKHVTMELGGKSPLIIFDDADVNEAVSATLMANFYSNGEVCSNGTRVFVQKGIKKEFTEKLVERTAKLKMGHPFDKSAHVSSLISEAHFLKVTNYVSIGVKEGAKILIGGDVVESVMYDGKEHFGSFLQPTVFDECTDEMQIVKEEIFGPVACLLEFSTYEEVIARANETVFGLAGGVFTKDIKLAHRAVKDIDAGVLYINNYNLSPVELPWGGNKLSGVGRENGIDAINEYMQVKTVYTELGSIDCPYE